MADALRAEVAAAAAAEAEAAAREAAAKRDRLTAAVRKAAAAKELTKLLTADARHAPKRQRAEDMELPDTVRSSLESKRMALMASQGTFEMGDKVRQEGPAPAQVGAAPQAVSLQSRRFGSEVIGCRVEILWDGDVWYRGVVRAFNATSDEHHVIYDDHDQKWHDLTHEEGDAQLRWLQPNESSGKRPPRPLAPASRAVRPRNRTRCHLQDAPPSACTAEGDDPAKDDGGTAVGVAPFELWRTDGHEWIGARVRRTVWVSQSARSVINGHITKWLPAAGEDEPALWHLTHDDGDEEDLEECEAVEAMNAFDRDLWGRTYADLITEYVGLGVRYLDSDADTEGGEPAVRIEHEALPDGETAESYFAERDVYVGNMYGHVGQRMYLASSHGRHFTTSCRDPFVVVLPKQGADARDHLRCNGWTNCSHVHDSGWPSSHPAAVSILRSGQVSGGMVRTKAVMFAALRWPQWYEFIPPHEDDWNFVKVVGQNDGVVTHMLGEAVMPAMAKAIMQCAAASAASPIVELVDLFCCGGGFSLGAAAALPLLRRVDGVDLDGIVLRNYAHNMPKAWADATICTHECKVPTTLKGLSTLLGRSVGSGTHVHASPPCQGFVNGKELDLGPYLELLLDAVHAGCTCSFEEHRDAYSRVLSWLDTRSAGERQLLFVYKMTARDYGSPTGRERCIVSSFALAGETNINVEM